MGVHAKVYPTTKQVMLHLQYSAQKANWLTCLALLLHMSKFEPTDVINKNTDNFQIIYSWTEFFETLIWLKRVKIVAQIALSHKKQ